MFKLQIVYFYLLPNIFCIRKPWNPLVWVKDFLSFEISSHFFKGFPISMVPSFHPRRLSTQLFFFLLFQWFLLLSLTSRRSVDVEANKKPSQLGGWKNYTAFSSHSSRANWRGNVSIVPFHCPLFEGLPAMKWRWKWLVAIGKPQIIMLSWHLWDPTHFVWTNTILLAVVSNCMFHV